MPRWTLTVFLFSAIAAVVFAPFAFAPAREIEGPSISPSQRALVIVTPHNEQIRYEFGRAFRNWHQRQFGESVYIDWRKVGGTGDIIRMLEAQFKSLARENRENDGVGYDLVWGGGDFFFDKQLKRGLFIEHSQGGGRWVSMTQPARLDPQLIRDAYPSPRIADRKLFDPDGHWWGVALSTFGIVYNRDYLKILSLPEPQTWSDLADPKYFGRVALADPLHSVSIRATYEAIVQRYGWDQGWNTLQAVAANARYFAVESSQVAVDTSTGEVAAGMSVDFFARSQATSVGGDRMGFIPPVGQTIVNADPIAILRGAPNSETAERFISFLLTQEGQGIWCFAPGEAGGPEKFSLRRPPARKDMFEEHSHRMVDKIDLFQVATALPENTPVYFDVLPTIMHAMAIDVHEDLKAAWETITAVEIQDRADLLGQFRKLPFTAPELLDAPARWKADPQQKINDRLAWTDFFRKNYQDISRRP